MDDLPRVAHAETDLPGTLELGAFSVSLNVADLARSRAFYEALGFEVVGGEEPTYLMMKNGRTTIGLFQGLFEGNILTFNPGLTDRMERLDRHLDIREIQAALERAGLELTTSVAAEPAEGPASLTLLDPDGNAILVDQFF